MSMKKFSLFSLLLVWVMFGCSTTANRFQHSSGIFNPTHGRTARYADPSVPVHPSQVSYAGIHGPHGDVAAALALSEIDDATTRRDIAATMTEISAHKYYSSYGGVGYGHGLGTVSQNQRSAFGLFHNPNTFPLVVKVDYRSSYTVEPGQYLEVIIPHGYYQATLYRTGGPRFGREKFSTNRPTRREGVQYDFLVRLDGL